MFWLQEYLILMKKMSKKCSTCVQLNRVAYIIGITCYKIGTLAYISKLFLVENFNFTTWNFCPLIYNFFSDQHNGVTCDSCKSTPIWGKRYKCLVCSNFDICEDCHSSGHSPQPCDLSHETSLSSSKSK
jgi:hypothetical protein